VRWRRTRRVMEITGALLTLLLAYFFVTIAISVELPARTAGRTPSPHIVAPEIEKKESRWPAARRQAIAAWRISGPLPASYDPLARGGFFVSWGCQQSRFPEENITRRLTFLNSRTTSRPSRRTAALTVVDYETRAETPSKASPRGKLSRC